MKPDKNEIKNAQMDTIYKQCYENSLDMYRTIDYDGKILACNNTYAENLGYTHEEIIDSSIFDHVANQSFEELKNTFETWRKTGSILNHEIWLKRKNGTTFPVLLSASNLYDENNKIIGSHTVIRDVSEIYEVKREVEHQKEKRLSTLGELSARIAHDLRNPLSLIKTSSELLQLKYDKENKENHFRVINTAISRMTHQIDEVLDFVKSKPLNFEFVFINEIIKSSVYRVTGDDDVKTKVPINDVEIKCDPEKLEIVFVNLLTNAHQAMKNKGNIEIRLHEHQDHIIIEIQDEGPGIPQEIIGKIFEPLFTTRQIGTGLGLPSCKDIIEKHEGTITVQNAPNSGAIFIINLPKTSKN